MRLPELKTITKNERFKKWLFPSVLIVATLLATVLGIHGSSIGSYHELFYGDTPDKNLIAGTPQTIRSDEWLVTTQMAASQAHNDFPLYNNDLGNQQDMSVIVDVPYKDWLTILRPWNLSFLVMPFDNAFAFKWWSMLAALGIAAYLFALMLFPRKYLLASLVSLFIMLSPFVHWWYREIVVMTLATGIGSLALALHMHRMKRGPWWQYALPTASLAYLLAVFAFVQYPPFQLMTAFALACFYIGYLISKISEARKKKGKVKPILMPLVPIILAIAVAGSAIGVFFIQHKETVTAITNTSYPGKRNLQSGEADLGTIAHLHTSYLAPQIARDKPASAVYEMNKSESSQFFQYSLILFVPTGILLVYFFRQSRRVLWPLVTVSIGHALIYIYISIPGIAAAFKPLLFNIVPLNRFNIGIGLLSLLQLLLLIKYSDEITNERLRKMTAAISAAVALVVFCAAGLYVRATHPEFISNIFLIVAGSAYMALALWLMLNKWKLWGMGLLVVLSLGVAIFINPLYRGFDILLHNPLSSEITKRVEANPNARWAATDLHLESYAIANGAKSITGNYSYPQKGLWKQFDTGNDEFEAYNRAVHVTADVTSFNDIELTSPNQFTVQLDPCSQFVRQMNITYIMSFAPKPHNCLTLDTTVDFPKMDIYIYKVTGTQ